MLGVTTRVFGEKNLTPITLVIVPRSVAIRYRTYYIIISFSYNENRVHTSEITQYTILVQAPWAKRQVDILRSGNYRASSLHPRSLPHTSLSDASQPCIHGIHRLGNSLQVQPLHTHKLSPKEWDSSRHQPYASFKWPKAKGVKSSQGASSGFLCSKANSKTSSSQLYHNTTAPPGFPGLRLKLTSKTPLESVGKLLSFPSQRPTPDSIPELLALTTQPIVLEEGEIKILRH
jgi:hypothetical protein